MNPNCNCILCQHSIRLDIESVFDRDRCWLGIFQVRARVPIQWHAWKIFVPVFIQMIHHGLLIESFDAQHDQFPRYLLTRLARKAR